MGEREKERRRNERDPKWSQPKRLSGTEFLHGMEDHRYRKPSTGNLASDSEGFSPSLFRSFPVCFGHSIYTFLQFAQLK